MVGEALKENPAYLKLQRIEYGKKISKNIANGGNKVMLPADNLLLDIQAGTEQYNQKWKKLKKKTAAEKHPDFKPYLFIGITVLPLELIAAQYTQINHSFKTCVLFRAVKMPIQNNLPVEALLTDVADFSPVLPDSVAQLLLNRAGLDTSGDPRIARIAALSAQKVLK